MEHSPAVLKRATSKPPDAFSAISLRERLGWSARRGLRLLGLPGVVAIGLLAMSPAFYFSSLVPAQEKLDQARNNAVSLQARMKRAARSPGMEQRTPTEQLAAFYRVFPMEKDTPQWLEKLIVAAESRGLKLEQGEYTATPDRSGKLVRFQITMPVKGEYTQIRKFLAALPDEVPLMALEQVRFERQKIADAQVEAKIKLALYLEQRP
jgi:Tfp pilus assembly protein PilO